MVAAMLIWLHVKVLVILGRLPVERAIVHLEDNCISKKIVHSNYCIKKGGVFIRLFLLF